MYMQGIDREERIMLSINYELDFLFKNEGLYFSTYVYYFVLILEIKCQIYHHKGS